MMRRRLRVFFLLWMASHLANATADKPDMAAQASATALQAFAMQTTQDALANMTFVALPKGCFAMGTAKPILPKADIRWTQLGYTGHLAADEMPRHEVCLDAFAIGQTEVSADNWLRVMGTPPPTGIGKEPASGMTWEAARQFADALTAQAAGAAIYRLPSEAEWEYACRAGKAGDIPPDRKQAVDTAWYNHWSGDKGYVALAVAATGSLSPNAWGLHDMLGNVWEWTEDVYSANAYTRHPLFNPRLDSGAGPRVIRGASYRSEYLQVRCSARSSLEQQSGLPQVGLRLVRQAREAK